MNTKVSYGSLSPAMIGSLGVVVRTLLTKGVREESPVILKHLPEVIELSDSGIWGNASLDESVDPRVFRVSDFDGDFRLDYISAPARSIPADKLRKFQLRDGDILVVKSSGSANQVVSGRVAVFEAITLQEYAASNFLIRLRPKSEVDSHYLAFILGSPPVRELVADSVKTMTYPNLSFRIYSEIQVPVIPLHDQRMIAEFFKALLNKRPLPCLPDYLAEERRIVARIEDLAAKIEEARGLRKQTAGEAEALIVSTHLRLAGGRTRKLGDLLTLDECQVGVTPTGQYSQVGLRGFGGGLFPKGSVSGTETTYRAFNQLYEGALVLSQVKGWEGAVGVCGSDLAGWFVSPEYRTFRCIPCEARPDYLAVLVRTEWFWGRLKDVTRGVGARRERTRPEQFLDLEMPMPELEQQEAGKRVFAEVRSLKVLQAETITELDALMLSILDRAFRAEL